MRSHHDVTPPTAYGYVPSVVSRTRVRPVSGATRRANGRGRERPASAASGRIPEPGLVFDAVEPCLHRGDRALELPADLEQRVTQDDAVDHHLRDLVAVAATV